MKIRLLLLFIALIVLFSSCKEDNQINVTQNFTGNFHGKTDSTFKGNTYVNTFFAVIISTRPGYLTLTLSIESRLVLAEASWIDQARTTSYTMSNILVKKPDYFEINEPVKDSDGNIYTVKGNGTLKGRNIELLLISDNGGITKTQTLTLNKY